MALGKIGGIGKLFKKAVNFYLRYLRKYKIQKFKNRKRSYRKWICGYLYDFLVQNKIQYLTRLTLKNTNQQLTYRLFLLKRRSNHVFCG
jgi:hypothetical protein